jgi:molybdate transport repressor ModE-like protein
MDLNQIEHFLRVAELGSINRAAKELGLSQPALSRSLSQLEQDLGQQLVVRCRTGITITEAGSILASRGLALLREAGFVVHRQRHHLAPVRRLASIIKSTLADAVRSGPWPGASIVG